MIPTYNRRERLLRAVRSVLEQRFGDYELIVVDDGSTDATGSAIAALGAPVKVISQSNAGVSAARNAGVRHARGTYVAFLDSDDVWLPWTLERYAAVLAEEDATWLSARGCDGIAGVPPRAETTSARRYVSYLAAASDDGHLPLPSGFVVKRQAFLQAGGFDESLRAAEDVDLWFRLGLEPGFVRMDAPVAFLREPQEDSQSRNLRLASLALVELVGRERRHRYPGATGVRRAILASELMGYAWQCRQKRHLALALHLYVLLAELQLRSRFAEPPFGDRRNRYLLTFPLQMLSPRLHDTLARLAGHRRGVAG